MNHAADHGPLCDECLKAIIPAKGYRELMSVRPPAELHTGCVDAYIARHNIGENSIGVVAHAPGKAANN